MPYADPASQRAAKREWARRDRAGGELARGTLRGTLISPVFRVRQAAHVLALLDDQIRAVLDDAQLGTVDRARTIGYLTMLSLRAIEATNIAARVEAIESVLRDSRANGDKK